ncbi:MAG: hypothetical protein H6621_10065 [Halobacteriovoraceae bacterium]|nr:hypothetical protein [Halobacteriovoraceae bacterium]MCB9095402.1 hypothetical protein [Halobacteriovoraceae bacterium]
MKNKAIQKFSDEYLEECKRLTADEILEFLENFRNLHQEIPSKSKLISIKIPEDLLVTFKQKAKLHKIPYQTQIKKLMKQWTNS